MTPSAQVPPWTSLDLRRYTNITSSKFRKLIACIWILEIFELCIRFNSFLEKIYFYHLLYRFKKHFFWCLTLRPNHCILYQWETADARWPISISGLQLLYRILLVYHKKICTYTYNLSLECRPVLFNSAFYL